MWPVLQVTQQHVRVPVHEVYADQLLTAGAAKSGKALAERASRPLQAGGAVLAVRQLAEGQRRGRKLTQLTTEGRWTGWFEDGVSPQKVYAL